MLMPRVLIIDHFDSFTYNLVQALAVLGAHVEVVRSDAPFDIVQKHEFTHMVLSPGPGAPEDVGIFQQAIAHYGSKIPTLGVCLGHQSIGIAFGARVVRAAVPMHGKTSTIAHTGQGIFAEQPSPLEVMRYHSLIIDVESLPPCLEVTATTEEGEIMAVAHRVFNIHGVQFHPESYYTPGGQMILKNFLGR